MKKVITSILCGELFLALFLFSGVFKESLGFPIDISIVFLGLTFISVVFKISSKKVIYKSVLLPIISLILVYVVLLISYAISPGEVYATDKVMKFTVVTIPAIVFSLLLFDNKQALYRFFMSVALLAFILSLISLPSIFQRGSSLAFIGFNGGNYQGLALLNGIGLIIQVFYFLIEARSKRWKVMSLMAAFITAFVLFASGSRMPIVAIVITTVYVLLNSIYLRRGTILLRNGVKLLLLFPIAALAALPYISKSGFFETIMYRFMVLFTEEGGGDSSSGRVDRYISSYEMIKESPIIGKGLGSFPLYFLGEDISDYPHNIVLEIVAEIGLVGLLACSIFFAVSLFRTLKFYRNNSMSIPTLGMVTIGIFIYYLAFSMVSGDINSNRILYVFMAIMCMFPVIFKNDGNENLNNI